MQARGRAGTSVPVDAQVGACMRVGANRMRAGGLGRPPTGLSGREWHCNPRRGSDGALLLRACQVGICPLFGYSILLLLHSPAFWPCTGKYNIYVLQVSPAVITP